MRCPEANFFIISLPYSWEYLDIVIFPENTILIYHLQLFIPLLDITITPYFKSATSETPISYVNSNQDVISQAKLIFMQRRKLHSTMKAGS